MNNLKVGEYVMASKWEDGDPHDHFAIGFYSGKLRDYQGNDLGRYMVQDSEGKHFRANGFRRCEKISKNVGDMLVDNIDIMGQASCSVWYWRYHPSQLKKIADSFKKIADS